MRQVAVEAQVGDEVRVSWGCEQQGGDECEGVFHEARRLLRCRSRLQAISEGIARGDADREFALRLQLAEEHLHCGGDGVGGVAEGAEGEGGFRQVGHDVGIAEVQQGDAAPGGGGALDEFAIRLGHCDGLLGVGTHAGEDAEDDDIGLLRGGEGALDFLGLHRGGKDDRLRAWHVLAKFLVEVVIRRRMLDGVVFINGRSAAVADDEEARLRVGAQGAVGVFQKRDALPRDAAGDSGAGFRGEDLGDFRRIHESLPEESEFLFELPHALHRLLDLRERDASLTHGAGEGVDGDERVGVVILQDQVVSGGDGPDGGFLDAVVVLDGLHREAVGDDDALEAELFAQQAGDDLARERGGDLFRIQRGVMAVVRADDAAQSAPDEFGKGLQLHGLQLREAARGLGHLDVRISARGAVAGEMHEDGRGTAVDRALRQRRAEGRHQVRFIADAAQVDDGVVGIQVHVEHRRAGEMKTERTRFRRLDPPRLAGQLCVARGPEPHRLPEPHLGAAAVADATPAEEQRDGR
ncbi:MAG: hypothetical protein AN484_24185 [Aphanizomenon flos-aquae WA102]|uniref:Uncharacterized protein n=1 Tax=Aphanizomenon flos-aquae WA102 TaxID=1710896 RepID=A0A1B7WN80_APHFL|nr:MAG: hypothetical protein AN484_24185 [Aphanizomenon flos-aquae WA102]